MSQHIYDYAVIGSGLTGLAVAARLSQETTNIALIESADHSGGMNRIVAYPDGPINNGLRFIPGTKTSEKALDFLENLLGMKIGSKKTDNELLTYSEGSLRPFIGFGEQSPEFYDELAYFLDTKQIPLKLEPYMWTQLLFEKFKGDFLPRSYVTKFHHENNSIISISINGAKTLKAHNYIYCGPIKALERLLPESLISGRGRHKIAKSTYWTAICLDLSHSEKVTDSNALHVLNGTTVDEIGPCVGRFLNGTNSSQWMTFVDEEASEDSEVVGNALKKMKRQIKRAYPTAFEGIKKERIVVAPMIGGNAELKVLANQSFPEAENLYIGSAALNPQKNLIGSILQAELILSSLGFAPVIESHPGPTQCI